jgi:hypothetical protein
MSTADLIGWLLSPQNIEILNKVRRNMLLAVQKRGHS